MFMTHDIDAETDAMGRLGRGTLVSVLRPTAASGTPNAQNCITSDLLHPSCQVATSELLSFFRSPMIERNRARQSHHNVSLPAFFSLLLLEAAGAGVEEPVPTTLLPSALSSLAATMALLTHCVPGATGCHCTRPLSQSAYRYLLSARHTSCPLFWAVHRRAGEGEARCALAA